MSQYEYTILDVQYVQIGVTQQYEWQEPTLDDINQLASQGWRLVATIPRLTEGPSIARSGFIFERPK
jgi:hypothetical protein